MAKKLEVKSQTQVRDPMAALGALAGLATPKAVAAPTAKKTAKPTRTLTGDKGVQMDKAQAARIVIAGAKPFVEAGDSLIKSEGHDFYIELGIQMGCEPPNPQLVTETGKSSCTHCEQGGSKYRIILGTASTIEAALLDAGVPANIASEVAGKVTVQTATTIKPLQELAEHEETKPVFQKVLDFLTSLPPEEQAVVIQNDNKFVVADDIRTTLFATLKAAKGTMEQKKAIANAALGVVKAQQSTTSNKFDGGLDAALDEMRGVAEPVAAETTTSTTIKTVRKPVSA